MLRDCPRLPEVGRRVGELSDHFELALEPGLAHRCAISIADARRVLGHCYAAKFYLRGRWYKSLESWTGALESLTETLEVAVLSNAMQVLPQTLQKEAAVGDVWNGLNVKDIVWDAEAVKGNLALVHELHNVVIAHTVRMKFHGSRDFQKHISLEEQSPTALPGHRDNADQERRGCSIL
jgi:hypothetical protein